MPGGAALPSLHVRTPPRIAVRPAARPAGSIAIRCGRPTRRVKKAWDCEAAGRTRAGRSTDLRVVCHSHGKTPFVSEPSRGRGAHGSRQQEVHVQTPGLERWNAPMRQAVRNACTVASGLALF